MDRSNGHRIVAVVWLMAATAASSVRAQDPADHAADLVRQSLIAFDSGENVEKAERKTALYSHALHLAEQAVALDDNSADAHYATFISRGRLVVLQGLGANPMRAATLGSSLERALELNPNHIGALVARGSLQRELPRWLGGDLQRAESDFKRALELDPDCVDARLGLIHTYVKADRLDDAERLLGDASIMRVRTRQQRQEADSLRQIVAASGATNHHGGRVMPAQRP